MSQLIDDFQALVRWIVRDITYHKHYLCTVQGQVGDELDVVPDDESLQASGLSRVPISYGLPGVSAQVAPGTKVTLFFENGDPKKPRVYSWVGGHISLSFANGIMPVARVGDTVSINPLGLTVADPVSGVLPVVGSAIGTITGGAPTVKA